mgnify:FL=1
MEQQQVPTRLEWDPTLSLVMLAESLLATRQPIVEQIMVATALATLI